MAAARKPGPECGGTQSTNIDDGTNCRQASPRPGPTGITLAGISCHAISAWDETRKSISKIGDQLSSLTRVGVGHGKSVLLSIVDLLPIKQDSPISTDLLKHYVKRSGATYTIDPVPSEWQDWIVKSVGKRRGKISSVSPYNSGLFDLRNSLGHFDLKVTEVGKGKIQYDISDVYQFGHTPNDKNQRGRHGFPLGTLSETQIAMIRKLLPDGTYHNPGGFDERWEIKVIGKETTLLIPQQFLSEQGVPFEVRGAFIR